MNFHKKSKRKRDKNWIVILSLHDLDDLIMPYHIPSNQIKIDFLKMKGKREEFQSHLNESIKFYQNI